MYSNNKQIRDVADVAARIMSGQQPVAEELKGGQKKLDKNHNGKLDGQDFKILRKEEELQDEEVEQQDEAMSHQAATTMKHIPNPSPALKKAAKDIKPGIAGYRDRIDMLKAGGVKEEAEQVEEAANAAQQAAIAINMKKQGKKPKHMGEDVMPPKHYGGKGVEGAKFDLYMQKRKQQNAAMKPKSVEEGIMNAVKNLAKKANKALTGGSDEDQRKDLQRKMGVQQTGKKPMQK